MNTCNESSPPKILYKYRDWKNPLHKQFFFQNKIWFASPQMFTDKYDCYPIYANYTYGELFHYFSEIVKMINPMMIPCNILEFVDYMVQNTPMRNLMERNLRISKIREFFNSTFGILSLSKNGDSKYMWEKYASNSTGICIGYEAEKIASICSGCGFVSYWDNLPSINFLNDDSINQVLKPIFNKYRIDPDSKEEYYKEEEFRFYRRSNFGMNDKDRVGILERNAIRQVTLGENMSIKEKEEIKSLLDPIGIEICDR